MRGVGPVQPLPTAWGTLHPTASRPLMREFGVTQSVLPLSCAHHSGPPTPGQSHRPHGPSRPHSDQGGLCAPSPFLGFGGREDRAGRHVHLVPPEELKVGPAARGLPRTPSGAWGPALAGCRF